MSGRAWRVPGRAGPGPQWPAGWREWYRRVGGQGGPGCGRSAATRTVGGEQFLRECPDRLADFRRPDPDGVEYQAVEQVAALQVRADRIDRRLDVGQSLALPVGHSVTRSRSTRARTPGLRSAAGIKSTRAPRMASRSALARPSLNSVSREAGPRAGRHHCRAGLRHGLRCRIRADSVSRGLLRPRSGHCGGAPGGPLGRAVAAGTGLGDGRPSPGHSRRRQPSPRGWERRAGGDRTRGQ